MNQSTKNYLLVAGFLVTAGIAYQFSFSKTIVIKEELTSLKVQFLQNSQPKTSFKTLVEREKELDSIIATEIPVHTTLQNSLLKELNEITENHSLKIINFNKPHVFLPEGSGNKITTFQFSLEGDYKNLEKAIYLLETHHRFGSVSHFSFHRKKDYKQNRKFIEYDILISKVE